MSKAKSAMTFPTSAWEESSSILEGSTSGLMVWEFKHERVLVWDMMESTMGFIVP